jgi:large subunit ribosomal protein L22
MPGVKTNERPGTKAVHRHTGLPAPKVRQVLDLIRGEDVDRAADILAGTEREAARVIGKVLASAVANAAHNDHQNPDELYVSACYADEGVTAKRWRPRARGRATRIRKRSSHITIVVSRLPAARLEQRRRRMEAMSANRSRRVDASRRRADLSGRLSRRRAAQAAAEAEAAAAAVADEAAEEEALDVTATDDVEVEDTVEVDDDIDTDDADTEDAETDGAETDGAEVAEADDEAADEAGTDDVDDAADDDDEAEEKGE